MEKHILNLLNTNLRVIIPDFGAFIIRQKEPLVLVFNEFLRYNDGLLIDYLAKVENIEKEMAKHQVTEFTENLVKVLETGKEIKLEGIGTLRKTGDEKIEFIQAGKETPKKSTKKVQEKKTDESPIDTAIPLEIVPEEPKTVAKPAAESKTKTAKNGNAQAAKTESKPVEPAKADSKPKSIEKPLLRQPPGRTPAFKVPVVQEKNNKRQQLIWIILIIVVVALINIWFIFNDPIKNFFSLHKLSKPIPDTLGQVVTEAEPETPAVRTETTDVFKEVIEDDFYGGGASEVKEQVVAGSKTALPGEKRFYIVAGCFRDEINAEEMVKQLNKKGYKAEKFGTIGNLHAVSYSSFADKNKAQQELERIRKEVAPEAWIVYY